MPSEWASMTSVGPCPSSPLASAAVVSVLPVVVVVTMGNSIAFRYPGLPLFGEVKPMLASPWGWPRCLVARISLNCSSDILTSQYVLNGCIMKSQHVLNFCNYISTSQDVLNCCSDILTSQHALNCCTGMPFKLANMLWIAVVALRQVTMRWIIIVVPYVDYSPCLALL
jgi:hypothetical protein